MDKADVKIGCYYSTKVSDKPAIVQITSEHPEGGWYAVNQKTGRTVRVYSALLWGEVTKKPDKPVPYVPPPAKLPDYIEWEKLVGCKAEEVANTDRVFRLAQDIVDLVMDGEEAESIGCFVEDMEAEITDKVLYEMPLREILEARLRRGLDTFVKEANEVLAEWDLVVLDKLLEGYKYVPEKETAA